MRLFEMGNFDMAFSAILLGVSLIGVITGIWGGFNAGFSFAFLLMFSAMTVYLARKGTMPGPFAFLCGILSLTLCSVFTFTSNSTVKFFSVIMAVITSVVWFASLAGHRIPTGDLGLVIHTSRVTFAPVGHMPRALASVFSFSKSGKSRSVSKALIGLVCAIPVLCIVIPLLVRSDEAFWGFTKNLIDDLGTLAAQLVVTLIIFPFILAFALRTKKIADTESNPSRFRGIDTVYIASFLGIIAVVYLLYMFSQLAYFFSAFSGFLPEGYEFTYAGYARRGFFEMSAVSAINLVLVMAALLLSRKSDGRTPGALKIIGTFISLFTLLLISTAISKMVMYIQNYGMTVLRLGTSAFMVILAFVFAALILRLFIPRVKVLHVAVAVSALVLSVLGIANVNAICARYNYEAWKSGKLDSLDYSYMVELGHEGIPYLVKLAEEDSEEAQAAKRLVRDAIFRQYYYYDSSVSGDDEKRVYSKLSEKSVPIERAYRALEEYKALHPDYEIKE